MIGPGNQGPVDWFTIADVEEPGTVQLGGLRLGETAHADLVFTLIFTPTATPLPSDRIQVEAANLAAPDGTVMTPMSGLPALTLDATQPPESSALELSPGVPNPFTTSTKFSVNLPRTAQVDLAVHDLAGRRIATMAHGVYGAGRRSFTWDGANARDGLYFVRLSVDGRVLSTRVALLRNGP
ncbi:MAG: T9SS type A sorting domain-containing protein [Deltaproteobacteria bacterium]|nr:MAG: T9SS type A sorting domain-containing protein [Deltaproteobacteria bacterium]